MKGTGLSVSCGRVLHVYSNRWTGPRPGMVVGGGAREQREFVEGGDVPCVRVNVFLDGHEDAAVLAICRARVEGNTFAGVAVLEEVRDADRDRLWQFARLGPATGDLTMWAEWPPRA